MKTILTLLISVASFSAFAADLFVQEFGGGGTYATINDAFTAASAGDRILILPKAANTPYIESLIINKSIQLLSASNGTRFYLQGSITISSTLPVGGFVVIDGVQITTGSITQLNTSTNPVNVSIVNSNLQNGTVSFGKRFNLTLANSSITSTSTTLYAVRFAKGNILGNFISSASKGIESNTDSTAANDTIYIVGNRVTISGNFSSGVRGLDWANTSYFFYIANNYFTQSNATFSGTSNSTHPMLRISSAFKPGTNSNEINTLLNNTIVFNVLSNNGSESYYGIEGLFLDNRCSVFNNLIVCNQTNSNQYGFNVSGSPQLSYNNVSNGSFNAGTVSVAGNTLQFVTLSGSTGCLTNFPDLGHPNPIFTDLDLTRNDWGACGGSFSINVNYPNVALNGTARVNLVLAPRRVLQGGTISISAEGHDR